MNIRPAKRATGNFLASANYEPTSFFEPEGGFERISGNGNLFASRFSNLTDIAPSAGSTQPQSSLRLKQCNTNTDHGGYDAVNITA